MKSMQTMKSVELKPHQTDAMEKLRSGSILYGGVGSGKSITSLAYFYEKETDYMRFPKDLYIITTSKKRDSLDWDRELLRFGLSTDKTLNPHRINIIVDSWNNIKKYDGVSNAFFIFDEDKITGHGSWAKTFIKISRKNRWIVLTATPGDEWKDYATIFIANNFYKNYGDFSWKHIVYNPKTKYPKIQRYFDTDILEGYRSQILVSMKYQTSAQIQVHPVEVDYNKDLVDFVKKERWDVFDDRPIKDGGELFRVLRKITLESGHRIDAVKKILKDFPRLIIFYNYDFELEELEGLNETTLVCEYNGKLHDPCPKEREWVYLVNYMAGAEAWECISTNAILFYSPNYSYKIMKQSAGRIDRMNTPYDTLHYFYLISESISDTKVISALSRKQNFNEETFELA